MASDASHKKSERCREISFLWLVCDALPRVGGQHCSPGTGRKTYYRFVPSLLTHYSLRPTRI
jgi:hypothetical protein